MHYEGKVTITLEDDAGVKISCPFNVELDEDLTFGESLFLFKKAIDIVDGILHSDIEQVTLDVFERRVAAEKTQEEVDKGTLDTPGVTGRTIDRKKKKGKGDED